MSKDLPTTALAASPSAHILDGDADRRGCVVAGGVLSDRVERVRAVRDAGAVPRGRVRRGGDGRADVPI